MNKKGQGISLEIIVIAAIVLVVLVVMIAIFLGGPVVTLPGQIDNVAPTELIKVQTQSPSRCKPNKAALLEVKNSLAGLSEQETPSAYDSGVQQKIDACATQVAVSASTLDNRQRCNANIQCTYI